MKKKPSAQRGPALLGPDLFGQTSSQRRRSLILSRFLAEEADKAIYRGKDQDRAYEILKKWAALAAEGHLKRKKETSLDADFLREVFGEALSYKPATQSPEKYFLERNYSVPGVGTADGALGEFHAGADGAAAAVIELKDADTDLDRDKFNGRTAVQQCWDYLNALPGCPWGIVSNFITVRLYHRDQTPLVYQEFQLRELTNKETFLQFTCLFGFGGLLSANGNRPRALALLERTINRQREVGDELYDSYSQNRLRLIEHLHRGHGKSVDEAIRIAQKILDRIIFVAFCEDRGLLPESCIEQAYNTLPPFSKVTNPRWQNFLNLFQAIDRGHSQDLQLENGYNGGLFRHDPAVDDLQLDDSWTNFFRAVGKYDFRDEVNVDVLGHLFEKSVGELEGLRYGAFFVTPPEGGPTMPKSAERKRFGIYYTPPEFTYFIVRHTLGEIITSRLEAVRELHQVTPEALESDTPSPVLAAFWRACLDELGQIKVCDPACGSGAFLIQAYDLLEEHYLNLVENLRLHDEGGAKNIADGIPERILADNLYGMDLSEQSVEITQLALWVRSARRGRTLADLSHHIVQGNSLVADEQVDPRARDWHATFPEVFTRANAGFDCMIGNPPWERLKLQEREFFALCAPRIAGAVSAAQRRTLIAELEEANPELHAQYLTAREAAERTLNHVRACGAYPLTGRGDVNTYMLFAELARRLVAPAGRVGLLVPSGIATDNTTKDFFADLMGAKTLVGLYDFENRQKIFPDVDGRFKFCVLLVSGGNERVEHADFVFFAQQIEDLSEKNRHIRLSSADMALLNPNTRTCPVFRFRRDAELTKAIYRRVPILIDESRQEGGNPWGIRFIRMFDQTNDAELFHTAEQLKKMGFQLKGYRWQKAKQVFLPLYEAKMIQAYDHRAASVKFEAANWVRQGQTVETTLVEHQNPEFAVQPRWWVEEERVRTAAKIMQERTFIGFKDITSPTNQRTMIAAAVPWAAFTNHLVLLLTSVRPRLELCLLANLNSLALDYVARQKIGGVTLNFFIVQQLPVFPPDRYSEPCPWRKGQTLEKWISERVLKLTCTANDMRPLAVTAAWDPAVRKWNAGERLDLMAELDAAFFHLYGIGREEVEYILSTFQGLKDQGEDGSGLFSRGRTIIETYDRLAGQ